MGGVWCGCNEVGCASEVMSGRARRGAVGGRECGREGGRVGGMVGRREGGRKDGRGCLTDYFGCEIDKYVG